MQFHRDLAIILRSTLYKDRHRVVTALSESRGVISAIAQNSVQSRRFGGSLDLFTASDWVFTSKPGAQLFNLSEAHTRQSFDRIRHQFETLSLASTFSELILRFAPQEEPCPELFKLLSNGLTALNELNNVSATLPLLNAYMAKLLQWSGNQPRLGACLQCERILENLNPEAELSCVIPDAGWICSECRTNGKLKAQTFEQSFHRISPTALRDFQISLSIPIRKIPEQIQGTPQDHQDLFKWIKALYLYHIPGFDQQPLKSLRFVVEPQSSLSHFLLNQ